MDEAGADFDFLATGVFAAAFLFPAEGDFLAAAEALDFGAF